MDRRGEREGLGAVAAATSLTIRVVAVAHVAGCLNSFGGHMQADTRMAMLHTEQALIAYAAKHRGSWPATLAEASPYMEGGTLPTDAWGRQFAYQLVDTETGYVLVSYGADGREGGEGMDADLRSDDPR